MFVNRGNFPKLVKAENKVDYKRRKMKNKGTEKAQRNRNTPHDDGIAQKAKAGVAAGTEDTGNYRGIDCLTDYIVRADQQHHIQIGISRIGQLDHRDNQRAADQDDNRG